jgi:heme/copper-type cytochrome/quinol oxidase subunit 4
MVARELSRSTNMSKIGVELTKFAFFAALTVLAAWVAATGRVAYMFTMLVIAAALAYAILDLVDYEVVKRKRQG